MYSDSVTFTHKGWMGILPVIMADPYGICVVDCRYEWMNYIMDVQVALHQMLTGIAMTLFPNFEPAGFAIYLPRELKKPITRKVLDY